MGANCCSCKSSDAANPVPAGSKPVQANDLPMMLGREDPQKGQTYVNEEGELTPIGAKLNRGRAQLKRGYVPPSSVDEEAKKAESARLCLRVMECKKAERKKQTPAADQQEDNVSFTSEDIEHGRKQIRQREIDECRGFGPFKTHFEWMEFNEKQPAPDAVGVRTRATEDGELTPTGAAIRHGHQQLKQGYVPPSSVEVQKASNSETQAAPDGELTPIGAAIRQGHEQLRQGYVPPSSVDEEAKKAESARLCLRVMECKKAERKKQAPAADQQEDNVSFTSEDLEQGRQQIRQRQIDDRNGFGPFKTHFEWMEWSEKQPAPDAAGLRTHAAAAEDGELTPMGAAIRHGRQLMRQGYVPPSDSNTGSI